MKKLGGHVRGKAPLSLFSGSLVVENGNLVTEGVSLIHARSLAENVVYSSGNTPYSGVIEVRDGRLVHPSGFEVMGKSLIHSALLTTFAFSRSIMKGGGSYIVALGLLLFAFSTAISWSYYGDRAVTFLMGQKYVIYYRIIFVAVFFIASFTDTTIIWSLSYIAIVLMAVPNLAGILILRKA